MFKALKKYECFIFDMDGTLIDSMPAHLQAWEKTATHFGFPYNPDWLHSLGGMPSIKIATEVNRKYQLTLEPSKVSQFKMASFNDLAQHGETIACTLEVFNYFYGKRKLAVGTGSQRVSAIKMLTKANLLDRLDAVVTASDVEKHKPNPDTFLKAAQQLGCESQQCVVFEDTQLGLQAAHAAKMDCMMVEQGELVFYPYGE